MSNLPAVVSADALVVRQQREVTEVFTNLETKNRYEIQLPGGSTVLYASEQGDGAMAFLTRNFLNTKRPFHIRLEDTSGRTAMSVHRPWRWIFSSLDVIDGSGMALGSIQQRFSVFSRRFSVLDPSGRELAVLHGPMLRPWTFRVLVGEQEVGKITKEWSGMLREAFTDADTFGVQFGPGMDPQLRSLALAATFLIDFLYFEHRNK